MWYAFQIMESKNEKRNNDRSGVVCSGFGIGAGSWRVRAVSITIKLKMHLNRCESDSQMGRLGHKDEGSREERQLQ